jgi:glyoxylase-like metal-dependent hydrolase (beta-lactamase superfamily II)
MSMGRRIMKVLGWLVALAVIGAIALALTFTPAKLEIPTVEVGRLPPASPPAEMSISALPTGTYDTPAALAYRGGSWSDIRHFASTALLIRHPRGNLLIDSGFGRHLDEHMQLIPSIQRSAHDKFTAVVDQLAAASMHSRDIAAIIPTHAHWDHISGIDDLREVPVMVTAAGRYWIDSKAAGTEVINSFGRLNYQSYEFEGGAYLGFSRSHDVWGDGSVVIVPAPGHTPDSVVVFVNLPSGVRYALLGDLVWQLEGVDIPAEKPWMLRWLIGEDNEEVRADISRIRTAIEKYPQIHPIPAHDDSAFRQIPKFPASTH